MKRDLEEREKRQFFLVPAGTDLGKDMVSLEQYIHAFLNLDPLQNGAFVTSQFINLELNRLSGISASLS